MAFPSIRWAGAKKDSASLPPGSVHQVASNAMGEVEQTELKRAITTRQFVFMAFGGTIGAGLLIGSYVALKVAGPGSVFIGFTIAGVCITALMGSLGELSSAFPTSGSFYDYSIRFISPSWGFAMGWNYIMNYILTVPLELTVMNLVAKFWNKNIHAAILIPIFIVCLIVISFRGAKWYGEAEHAFGILKIFMLVTFSLAAIVVATGGVSTDPRHGTHFSYWENGKAFKSGAAGFLYVFVAAGLAYGGTEILGLAAAECQHPEKTMPLAYKIVAVRIVLCYLIPLFMMGLIVGDSTFILFPKKASPFVISMKQAGISVLPDIFNAVILVAVFSMANSCVFASSRALRAMCARGMGPKILAKTRNGTPMNALVVVFIVSLLAFINVAPAGDVIFDWLLALASASNFFTWLSISVSHIRLRMAIKKQGLDPKDVLGWVSPMGIPGSIVTIIICLAGLISLIVTAAIPPAGLDRGSEPGSLIIVRHALGIAIVFCFWFGHICFSLWKKREHPLLIPLDQINLSKTDTAVKFEESTSN
ncbi:amino acid permease [Seiridium cupressi]